MMRRISLLVLMLAVTGCYRITVNTGAPASATVIDKPWQMSFVFGLVPPPEIDAKPSCPQGVATVVTEHSFVNGLVAFLSGSLVTPLHANITCASGPRR